MSGTPSTRAQNVWETQGGQDFLQMKDSHGTTLSWIDSSGIGQGSFS